ncbi:cardiolipin synthase [Streptococcus sciuri]|uniref:Cardiolipin synthase n=1 Tax=Streptococcus sciuri TaxID=2973939 RepID=A0ABT2F763_9STRE|nr:cardiolipin synthase [Streptococcus sciuri]
MKKEDSLIVSKSKPIYLLKKGQRGLERILFSRLILIILLLFLQIVFIAKAYIWLDQYRTWFFIIERLLSLLAIFYLINGAMDALSRVTWLILIMIAPLLGSALLLYTRLDLGYRELKRRIEVVTEESAQFLQTKPEILTALKSSTSTTYHLVRYFEKSRGNFPAYQNTQVIYFPLGEHFFSDFKKELLNAKKYIFLEFFIIDEGIMWGEILNILERKVSEGVEVRVMYDGLVEITKLSTDYVKRLEAIGIKAKSFSPVMPFLSTYYNYRDHRKIAIIDGEVAYTGGVNLADEYINVINRFGHWKDTAIKLKGDAVDSFLLIFLQLWSTTERELLEMTVKPYLVEHDILPDTSGYVIPYADSPLDQDKVGENVYIDILNHARRYVYIMTPYLILDSELEHAIRFAAERGVDVRIIMPGIPDKPMAYYLAKTYYRQLMNSGVKIYQYTPGFVHAKVFVSDHSKAVVGTINLDYRSLYHHFECATYMYKVDAIKDIYADFLDTQEKSELVTIKMLKERPLYQKIAGSLVKTIAPLL